MEAAIEIRTPETPPSLTRIAEKVRENVRLDEDEAIQVFRSRDLLALGQLAAFEMTSSLPNRRYGNGLRRLGGTAAATRFYDEHVEADAAHEQIAATDMCGSFALAEPERAGDVLFGAACGLALDNRFADHLLGCWRRGETSLRVAVPAGPVRSVTPVGPVATVSAA